MAANNYFGYTTGTQPFGTTSATSYPASQTTNYAVQQHAAQQYAAAAPRTNQTAATYDTYQNTGHATYQYTARQQPGYDKTQTQTYYTQAAQVAYSTPETPHYQTGVNKTTYTANATGYGTARPATTPKNQAAAAAQQTAANSYVYSTNSAAGATGNYTSSYNTAASTSYPATMYVQQPAVVSQQSSGAAGGGASAMQQAMNTAANVQKSQGAGWGGFKKGFFKTQKPKAPPKPQQLHYCDVCKISCAGPQTYKEHLEGQKHKKKETSMKITQAQNSRGGTSLRCELCDVTCTGFDAYAAHIRGAKHQKVVKLHTKLGKPIPSTEPQVLSTNAASPTPGVVKGPVGKGNPKPAGGPMEGKKVLGTPKINFVGGTKLNTTASPEDSEDLKDDDGKLDGSLEDRNDVQPVGQDYIEEIRNDEGKVISFQCKLCECRFNDPNAKEMHMKGRRHRLQYKKKVNPDLIVDIKPSLRQRKIQEERLRRQQLREDLWKRREEERWREEMSFMPRMMEEEERMYWEERRRYEEEMEYYDWYRRYGRDPRMMPPPPPPRGFMGPSGPNPMMPPRRPDSVDDRHIMAKHTQIYPKEEELSAVQKIVTNTEKALKLVSDFLAESDKPKEDKMEEDKKPEVSGDGAVKEGEKEKEPLLPARVLKGVMRVGVLAKGLLLTGDASVQLVVMCAEKPTRTLLDRVADNLPKQFAAVSPDDKYEVKRCVEEAALKVECAAEPTISVLVTLTSPVMRESAEKETDPAAPATAAAPAPAAVPAGGETVKDPPDVLDRQKCLDALAALRHAKWFQARASGLQSCVMIIRIMRDLCQRVPTWGRLSNWAVELLVEKVISSAGQYLSPGDAVRRVFEAVAGGLLLPGGPGLLDPCEKDALDAAVALSNQEREDITASSQHALRLIAFRQIHKVLGMDALPPPKFTRGQFNRKRRRDNSAGEGNDSEGAEGKKDKKEDSEAMETPEAPETK